MELFFETLNYVVSGPHFWLGMGFLTAVSMFIGAVLYDGEIPQARKGFIGLIAYIAVVLWLGIERKVETLATVPYEHQERVFASSVVLIIAAFFYALGLAIGVAIIHYKYRDKIKSGRHI